MFCTTKMTGLLFITTKLPGLQPMRQKELLRLKSPQELKDQLQQFSVRTTCRHDISMTSSSWLPLVFFEISRYLRRIVENHQFNVISRPKLAIRCPLHVVKPLLNDHNPQENETNNTRSYNGHDGMNS